MKRTPFSVLALLLAAAGCARHTIPPVVLTSQVRFGPAEDFGPGIVDVTESDVDLKLDAPAYWLLIVSDAPTPAGDVMRRLGLMNLAYLALGDLVRSIPEPLIDSRTTHWAAYYAPFGGASIP